MAGYPDTVQIFTDGCAKGNPGPAGAGFVLKDAHGRVLFEASIALGRATNNEAEYRALLLALDHCVRGRVHHVVLFTDSLLMANQLNGIYRIRNGRLARLAEQAQALRHRFLTFQLKHIPRSRNVEADRLANQAIDEADTA